MRFSVQVRIMSTSGITQPRTEIGAQQVNDQTSLREAGGFLNVSP